MKAIILIAGEGSRLKPLTNYIPKCCLPIAGVPLLHIWIKNLLAAHVTDILLNPSHRDMDYVMKTVMAGIPIPRITSHPEREPLGTARTIWRNRDWIGNDDFYIIYGDVLTNFNVWLLAKTHRIQKESILTVVTYATNQPQQKGIFAFNNGWATDFEEKPEEPMSNLAFAGVAVAGKRFVECLKQRYVDIGLDVLPRIINKQESPRVFIHHDPSLYFKDIGTIPDYLSCQAEWKQLSVEKEMKDADYE